MSDPEHTERAAKLIERVLTDAHFRSEFRRDPVVACRSFDLHDLAEEFDATSGTALHTLELRESKSSLAGVLMAAAAEGMSVLHFAEHVVPHAEGPAAHAAHAAVARATLHTLPAVHRSPDSPPPAMQSMALAVAHPSVSSVLNDPRFHFSAEARSALASGDMAQRVAALFTNLTGHSVTIGRVDPTGVEITAVDGHRVDPANLDARDLVEQLAALPASQRPGAVESPWPLDTAGFVKGAGYRHRIAVDLPLTDAPTGGGERPGAAALAAITAARRMLGKAYVWGGDSPPEGFDCSGLVEWAYHQAGVTGVPRTTWDQIKYGTPVEWGHFKPGDLVFSNFEGGSDPTHVVMYIGHGKVIAAPHTGTDVQIENVNDFRSYFVGARRVVPLEHAAGTSAEVHPLPGGSAVAAEGAGGLISADPETFRAAVAVKIAERYLGTPYDWGGETPTTGFDCSGLMEYVWGKVGVHLDRVSEKQFYDGVRVPRDQLRPGDLVFFQLHGDVHHVGMYVGNGRFIEAPHTGDVVKYARLDDPYYKAEYAGARRVSGLAAPDAQMPAWAVHAVQAEAGGPSERIAGAVGPITGVVPAVGQSPGATVRVLPAVGSTQVTGGHAAGGGLDALVGDDLGYPGDQASAHQYAVWMAAAVRKHGLPPELPIMAALVESGMRNLSYGDADSVGFFQMRPSVWDASYPGFEHNPGLQLRWFIDQAVAVRAERVSEGAADPTGDPNAWGNWIADVERPAAQFRYRYQERLEEARKLLAG